jgi:spermidine synthase
VNSDGKLESNRLALGVVLGCLFLSGTASIINQVVWQRGLKVFLGGSESISSMVVVLVFMLGLGLGAAATGARARRLVNPLRVFGWVELALCVVNASIAFLLSLDLSESIYGVQRLAVATGIPLRAVYAVGALLLLLPPTVLMGATLPVASEGCQRQLGATHTRLITLLFFLNTLGAVLGAFGSSFVLLPYFGQQVSLLGAAGFNLVAGGLLMWLSRDRELAVDAAAERARPARHGWRPTHEEWLGFGLGFLSLAYEMLLLRLVALVHGPLPFTFATTLCFYLLFWSVGVFTSSRFALRMGPVFGITALAVAIAPFLYEYDRFTGHFSMFRGGLLYFLPCIGFGVLYGLLVSGSARDWGNDVGRYYAWNTVGSCLGIAVMTLVGYELPLPHGAFVIGIGVLLLLFHWLARREEKPWMWRAAQATAATLLVAVTYVGWWLPYSEDESRGQRTYWGRDGVVELHGQEVLLDGMWHTHLAPGNEHVGRSYTWMMAVAALLSHEGPVRDVLVIGNGVGLTATTLAWLPDVKIDAYEINRTLKDLLRDYEKETLGVAKNPKIDIEWTDARSGMALNPKRYDIIVSAPLYLRQAGSSTLLSREYFELLERRLKPGGVVALYAHEGAPAQGMLVRRTVASVFAHQQSFDGRVVLVASNSPIEVDERSLQALQSRGGALAHQLQVVDRRERQGGRAGLLARVDRPSAPVRPGRYLITDDHPLVEYPEAARRLVRVP